ncbi:hypothetical protein ACMC9M_08465 [Pseudomonadota bacterium 24LQ007]
MKERAEPVTVVEKKRVICEAVEAYDGEVETALRWFFEQISALNGERPIDCFQDRRKLNRLKAAIRKIATGDLG